MNQIIEKAKLILDIMGKESFHPEILGRHVIEQQAHNKSDILTDEEFNVLLYFTAIGSGKVYDLAQEISSQELKDFLGFFDSILQKLPIEKQNVVYRMDTYDKHSDIEEYITRYKRLMSDGSYIKIPWSLSVSLDNWNKDYPENPIWEIELLETNTRAHSIYPLLEKDGNVHDLEKEVRFESNTILKIISVSKQDGYPYVKMKECSPLDIYPDAKFKILR